MNLQVLVKMVAAVVAMNLTFCGVAQETDDWAGAKVTKTDLLADETIHGKIVYFFAAVMTRSGCHVVKVEGERGKEMFARLDGRRGKGYENIFPPVFSPDGSSLGYGVSGVGGSRFVINEHEGPLFDEIIPETFVFSNDGKRHAYLARKAFRLVAVIDGVLQADAGVDLAVWNVKPTFSPDGSKVAYVARNKQTGNLCVVVNGMAGDLHEGLDDRF